MKWIKIALAIALLICLAPMPYGYYMLVRYASTVAFGVMAYNYGESKKTELCIACIVLSLLFQPFVKIPLGREIWNFVDVVVAIFLISLSFKENNKKTE